MYLKKSINGELRFYVGLKLSNFVSMPQCVSASSPGCQSSGKASEDGATEDSETPEGTAPIPRRPAGAKGGALRPYMDST